MYVEADPVGVQKCAVSHFKVLEYTFKIGWGIVAYPVLQAIGRPDFEDVLRTRSPGEVVSDRLSVRTSSMVTLVSILG